MPIKIFKELFYGTSVAFYDKYDGFTQMDVKFSGSKKYFTLTNPVDQEGYVVIDTYAPRNYPRPKSC